MKKALIGVLIFCMIIGGLSLFDYLRSRSVLTELVSITPETVEADPNQAVSITVKTTKHGKPLAGHDISALVVGSGNLKQDQLRTGADGIVTFIYYPYRYLEGMYEDMDVTIIIRDISDSVFIAIQNPLTVTLHVTKPETIKEQKTMEDIFGED